MAQVGQVVNIRCFCVSKGLEGGGETDGLVHLLHAMPCSAQRMHMQQMHGKDEPLQHLQHRDTSAHCWALQTWRCKHGIPSIPCLPCGHEEVDAPGPRPSWCVDWRTRTSSACCQCFCCCQNLCALTFATELLLVAWVHGASGHQLWTRAAGAAKAARGAPPMSLLCQLSLRAWLTRATPAASTVPRCCCDAPRHFHCLAPWR